MVVVRKWGENHINKSLRQIDSNTWLVGSLILKRSPCTSDVATWNDDGDHSSYTLTEASVPLPITTSPDSPYITLVHEAGDASAVWSIGYNAFCKVRHIEEGTTSESITLDFVQKQRPSFNTPKVINHTFGNDRSYLFLRRLPGRTLDAAWPTLKQRWRLHYVNSAVNICKEMAEWKGHRVGGVDNRNIPEHFLITPRGSDNFDSVHAGCEAIGMDCSEPVFYHADLGPGNIIVEEEPITGETGIIDFEIAGFFPRGWIRTKFRLSGGMDLSASASDTTWWRAEVQKALGAHGFKEYAGAWMQWRG
jgi:hypothetical protein